MFYRNEAENIIITCQLCSEIYNDPRLLPCGEAACHACIQKLAGENRERKFNCSFCNQRHQAPGNQGFTLIRPLAKVIQTRAEKNRQKPPVNMLTWNLPKLKYMSEKLKFDLDNGIEQAKEHCIGLKSQVQLAKELMMERLQQHYDNLISEIDTYEKQCISSFKSKKSKYYCNSDKLFAEMAMFDSDCSTYLKQFKLDDRKVEKAWLTSEDYLSMLCLEKKLLESAKFDDKVMKFKNNQNICDSSLIGVLNCENRSGLKFICKAIIKDNRNKFQFYTKGDGNIKFVVMTIFFALMTCFELLSEIFRLKNEKKNRVFGDLNPRLLA
jgi:hypothetical protein